MTDDHDHEHTGMHPYDPEHNHPVQDDQDDTMTYYRLMETAVRELLIEKKLISAEQVRVQVEKMDARVPANGAKIVARAWTDLAYKNRLIKSPQKAIAELGHDIGPMHLIVLENTDAVHNVVVCTLCSCYPRWVLGLPPDWYKSRNYRTRTVSEPRKVLKDFGTHIPDAMQVRVHDSTADMRYMVLPERPTGTDGMSVEELEKLVTRDSMIGVVTAASAA